MFKRTRQPKYQNYIEAIVADDLEEIQQMHRDGISWWSGDDLLLEILRKGNVKILQYAYEKMKIPFNSISGLVTAEFGHLECLKYMHENNYVFDSFSFMNAAANGQLECLKFAHSIGVSLDFPTARIAAANGRLRCFEYCYEVCADPQKFWDVLPSEIRYNSVFAAINLDKPLWRTLFNVNIYTIPYLHAKVEAYKQEIEEMKQACTQALHDKPKKALVCKQVLEQVLFPYF